MCACMHFSWCTSSQTAEVSDLVTCAGMCVHVVPVAGSAEADGSFGICTADMGLSFVMTLTFVARMPARPVNTFETCFEVNLDHER